MNNCQHTENRSNGEMLDITGADPGFPVGRGLDPPGVLTYDFAKISKKLHEIENILVRGEGGRPP